MRQETRYGNYRSRLECLRDFRTKTIFADEIQIESEKHRTKEFLNFFKELKFPESFIAARNFPPSNFLVL